MPMRFRTLPAPGKGAVIAATLVVVTYLLFFAGYVAQGNELDPTHAVIQIVFQVIGWSFLTGIAVAIVRKLW